MSVKLSAVFTAICVVIGASSAIIYDSLGAIQKAKQWTVHTYQVIQQLDDIVGGMVNSETGVRGYLVSGNTAFLEPLESGQKQYNAAVAKVAELTSDNAIQQKRIDLLKQNANGWLTTVAQREIALMKDPATQSEARALEASGAGKKTMDALRSVVQEMKDEELSLLSVRAAASDAAVSRATLAIVGGGGLTLIISILGAFGLNFTVTRPVQQITREMSVLATGNTSAPISGTERRDEIGRMAEAVQVFRTNMIEVERLKAEQQEAERRNVERRKSEMLKMANDFEVAVGEIVETVSSASTELEASAGILTGTAQRAQERSAVVASASEEASANVQSVAVATEEMASSVSEISRQVLQSAEVANDAVDQARKTNDRVGELSKVAARIGDVVELINTIAGQTNLLALNATIEAARAGAKATNDIGQQITGIQAATRESVGAINEISGTIEKLSGISAAIASAVEEQGAATQEISRNVQQAAQRTQQVSSNIVDVQRDSVDTGAASSQVLSAAQSLSKDSNRLKLEVGKFLHVLRAA